jgi:hypothetical protein
MGFSRNEKKRLKGQEVSVDEEVETKNFIFSVPTAIDTTTEDIINESIESTIDLRKTNINLSFKSEREAWKKLPRGFKLDLAPEMTHVLFCDIVAQFTAEKEVDLYSERIDGFLDNIKEIDNGLNKYVTLKMDWELEKAV